MRKPVSRLGMYADVREILDAALASGGGEVTLPSHGQAIHWRQRAYKFRKLYAEGVDPHSPYDRLTFQLPMDGETTVVLIKSIGQPAKFTPAVGQAPVIPNNTGDELFDIAAELARKLEGE